jgi:hypothetical protein
MSRGIQLRDVKDIGVSFKIVTPIESADQMTQALI